MRQIQAAYICDSHYILGTLISIKSLVQNADRDTEVIVHVLGVDLQFEDVETLEAYPLSKGKLHIHHVHGNHYDFGWEHSRVSRAALVKFALADILSDVDKVLYLDSDTIVNDSVQELYDTELEEDYAAVVLDMPSIYEMHWEKELGLHEYFSSGVMLLNLRKLRKDNLQDTLIQIKRSDTRHHFMDQDAFNIAFYNKVKYVSLKYNVVWECLKKYPVTEIARMFSISSAEVREILRHPVIIHFADSSKPWNVPEISRSTFWYKYMETEQMGMCLAEIIKRQNSVWNQETGKMRDEITALKEEILKLNRCVNDIQESFSFRFGLKLTYIPRMIQACLRNLRESRRE